MTVGRIVVGVDGSLPSLAALRWAVAEGALRGATVEAVHVWHYPLLTYAPGIAPAPVFAHDDLKQEARTELDRAVAEALPEQHGARRVERVVLYGSTSEQLVQAARNADMLIVGHRGRGGFAELLLGSVAHQCSMHAPCPVVIVRDGQGSQL